MSSVQQVCLTHLPFRRAATGSLKWTMIMVGYLFGLAYLAAFIVYHVAVALGGG